VIPSAIIENGTIKPILYAQPVTIGGVDYPANIFDLWSAAELAVIGIHPLIYAPSLLPYHIAGAPAYTFVAGEALESRVDTPMLLADVKAQKQMEIDQEFDAAIAQMTTGYPQMERESWATQEAEAEAYSSDPLAATPMLTKLATARGLTVDVIAKRVITNAAGFKAAAGDILGRKQARSDALYSAATFTEAINA